MKRFPHHQNSEADRPPFSLSRSAGYSFAEILIALSIVAVIATVVAVSFGTIVSGRTTNTRDENIPVSRLSDFYGITNVTISVGSAPDYGATAMAENMRNRLYEDLSTAAAVYCLGRGNSATARISDLPITSDGLRTVTNAAAFLALLTASGQGSGYSSFSGAATATNSSLFILNPSASTTNLPVRAIYETDLLPTTNPNGVYASVRRYSGTTLTDYYHVFYPADSGASQTFRPLAFHQPLTNNIPRPFWLVWWPDPSVPYLPPSPPGTLTGSRSDYTNMAEATSYFFVIPVFPSVQ
jgi:hypothetical protein